MSKIGGISQLSSGETEILAVAVDIVILCALWDLDGIDERIILIDEADLHLHFDLQQSLADFLVGVARRFRVQLIVATHSTTMMAALGHFGGADSSVLYFTNTDGVQVARKFSEVDRELSACLGGHVLMGPLFGAPVLLVEGDDDYRIWSEVPRHHVISLAVAPCGGRAPMIKYQRTLESIFESILSPGASLAGIALVDGDSNLTKESAEYPQKHVRYVGLDCREAENLYFTREVLESLGKTWDECVDMIVDRADEFGDERRDVLAGAKSWDVRWDDLKDVVMAVQRVIDDDRAPWFVRVGKRMGAERPTGELGSFLGTDVVSAIWGAESAG